jgi:hypothetical protein
LVVGKVLFPLSNPSVNGRVTGTFLLALAGGIPPTGSVSEFLFAPQVTRHTAPLPGVQSIRGRPPLVHGLAPSIWLFQLPALDRIPL